MAILLGRHRRPQGGIYSRNLIINYARFVWIILVVLREIGSFFWAISGCSWPDSGLAGADESPAHVLLVADAQARLDAYSSSPIGLALYDSFLRRAWHVALRLKPHAIIFLGDMLAPGATLASGEEYQRYHTKFKRRFAASVPELYLPGNNDVGLGSSKGSKRVRQNYSKSFGPFNQKHSIRNHTLVLLDSPGLVEEDYARTAKGVDFSRWHPSAGGSVEFLNGITRDTPDTPIILFTHIPLFRPDSAQCGSLRERGGIRRGVGHGYQNTLGKQTTTYLLESLRPSIVFSADNRDYCEYIHSVRPVNLGGLTVSTQIREVTVKSFSQARHIRHPGFQLLSLTTPLELLPLEEQKSFADRPCTLPDVSMSYTTVYSFFAVFTLLALCYLNSSRSRRTRIIHRPPSLVSSPNGHRSRSPLHSPLLQPQPDSAIWSPYTPVTSSPKNSFPSRLRTSNNFSSSTPTLHAFARPSTPKGGSPLLSPMRFPHDTIDEEEESVYPTHYATRALESEFHDEEDGETGLLEFLPAPPPTSSNKFNHAGWSWTFVFRGRRRRITIPRPSLRSMQSVTRDLISLGSPLPDQPLAVRAVLTGTLLDAASVFWPVCLLWWILVFVVF